jgi:hypothetical protein
MIVVLLLIIPFLVLSYCTSASVSCTAIKPKKHILQVRKEKQSYLKQNQNIIRPSMPSKAAAYDDL